MNAKHSAILLSGLLLLMIGFAWAQTTNPVQPTCPAVIPEWNANWRPSEGWSKWVRADWNAKSDQWEIDCDSEMSDGNSTWGLANAIPPARSRNYNSAANAANAAANFANYNMAANAVNATPKRRPTTRRRPSE